MAAPGGAENDQEFWAEATLGLVVIIVALVFCGTCCSCCICCCVCGPCRSRFFAQQEEQPAPVNVQLDDKEVPAAHLRKRKDMWTAYVLWLFAGAFGAHLFYLERVAHGFMVVWSGNFLMAGWFLDALMLPYYVRAANYSTIGASPPDGTFRRLLCRLPPTIVFWLSIAGACLLRVPRALHDYGAIDLDQRIAGTVENPYDLLGIPRGSDAAVAIAAHRELSRQLSMEPVCGEGCENLKVELDKALGFFDGTAWQLGEAVGGQQQARRPGERLGDRGGMPAGWADWSDFLTMEWKELTDALRERLRGKEEDEENGKEGDSTKSQRRPPRRRRSQGKGGAPPSPQPRKQPPPAKGPAPARGGRESSAAASPTPSAARKGRRGKRRGSTHGSEL